MLPASWMTQSAFLTPAAFILLAGALAGDGLVLADVASAPNSLDLAAPELIVMTGMPAATAFSIDALSASGLAIETTMPSTFWLTAASISCDCLAGSPSLW